MSTRTGNPLDSSLALCVAVAANSGCGDNNPKAEKKDKAEKSKKEKKSKKKSKDEKKDEKPDKSAIPDLPSQKLTIAISPDIPPYVMQEATHGFEVDLVQAALEGHELTFVQMPYKDLQTAVAANKADVAVGVQPEKDGGHYSDDFVTFANFAISKRADGFKIRNVADLMGRKVIAWQDAYSELGPEFEKLFAPSGTDRQNYREIADQREQVEAFWKSGGVVIVIDRTVFSYFTKELGYSHRRRHLAQHLPRRHQLQSRVCRPSASRLL